MPQYFTTRDSSLPGIGQVGGKGLALMTLAAKGCDVPPAAVLPTGFFSPWIERLKATPEWRAYSQAEAEALAAAAEAVKSRCRAFEYSEDQRRALAAVRDHLRSEGAGLMAVRSSSPEEDLEGASFAGIYETRLGVTEGGLEAAIRDCFASALDERVAAYKRQHGFDPWQLRIAVVIQQQVAADVAGVAFSLSPVTNCYDDCVINANFGLGVTVVDGTVTPDQAVVDKVTSTIREKTPGVKECAVFLRAEGGTETRPLEHPSEFCLTDEQILAVAALATRVEAEYGRPVDVEWAYAGGQLYLLQARPITTYYRLPPEMVTAPGQQKNLYHDANLTEQGLPENMSPLGESVFFRGGSLALEVLGADSSMTTIERGIGFGCAGRTYTNIGRMIKLTGKKNLLSTIRPVDVLGARIMEAMDLSEYVPRKLPRGLLLNFIKTALGGMRMVWPLLKAGWRPAAYLEFYLAENEKFKARLKKAFEKDSPFTVFNDFAMLAVVQHISFVALPPLVAAERARGIIQRMFRKEPESVRERSRHIEQAFPNNVTIEMGLALYDLSQLPDVQRIATSRDFVQKLAAGDLSPEFIQGWRSFIDRYGFRCPKEADVATPRYYERPEEVFDLLKTTSANDDPEMSPRAIFERAAGRRAAGVQFLETYLADKGWGKASAFRRHYKLLETFAAYRETPKYLMILAIDYIRRRALAMAGQWVKAGRLDSVDQVFDLRYEDIARAETDPDLDVRALARANRAHYAQFNPNADPPNLIDSRGRIPALPAQPPGAGELVGTPAAPGTVTGPVKVLKRPDEKPILPGDILVTKATDPGWTTLFLNAGGVLLETGGTLQHGASVARESGKPCIVGIERVTKILRDGQTVELDGAAGKVRILKGQPAEQPAG